MELLPEAEKETNDKNEDPPMKRSSNLTNDCQREA